MSSKKIITSVLALMISALSVTSFAADVTTTTTYNTESGKVEVSTGVSGATAESEITYIVKSNGEVVYIDQDTASDGAVAFDYKISKDKIASDYSTSVKFGSSSETDTFTGTGTESLGIVALQQGSSELHYSITYDGDKVAWANGDKVTATVVADDGYEITAICVDDVKQDTTLSNTVELSYGQVLTAEVAAVEVTPGLESEIIEPAKEPDSEYMAGVVILNPIGNVASVGVVYNGDFYPSMVSTEMSAVKIIFPATETDYTLIPAYKLADSDTVYEVPVE